MSIIIPTYNERGNVFVLADRIQRVLVGEPYELIFVDDSTDDTPAMLAELAHQDAHVRFLHRQDERGLGTAVMRGFEMAKGSLLTVMDADLQHPPEMLPSMVRTLQTGVDLVIPSRFIPGGDDGGLDFFRKLISLTARYMAIGLLKSVRPTTDPTSGFFMFRKAVIEGVTLRPIGWKILIEILARGRYQRVAEIPYAFHARAAGESKMSLQEQWNYVRHLGLLLADSPGDRRFLLFALVGISGVAVNMLVYEGLIRLASQPVTQAGFISALVAMCSNFLLNNRFTWVDSEPGPLGVRFAKFVATSLVGIGVCVGLLNVLYHQFGLHYRLANLSGIAVATGWNYLINNLWTWRNKEPHVQKRSVERWSTEQVEALAERELIHT
ncbi:MAG TPA: glycosyltransferase family 2 protein [Stenomitos sp.]